MTSTDAPRLNVSQKNPHGRRAAKCLCDCGAEPVVALSGLKSGHTKSCGCLRREKRAARGHTEKACRGCGVVKPLAEFHREPNRPDGHRDKCRICASEDRKRSYDPAKAAARNSRRRQADPEKEADRVRRWQQANSERMRAGQARYRQSIWSQVLDHYGRACACCGTPENLSVDHVDGDGLRHRLETFGRQKSGLLLHIWLIKNNFPEGFQILCRPCNSSKGTGECCRIDHAGREDWLSRTAG